MVVEEEEEEGEERADRDQYDEDVLLVHGVFGSGE